MAGKREKPLDMDMTTLSGKEATSRGLKGSAGATDKMLKINAATAARRLLVILATLREKVR